MLDSLLVLLRPALSDLGNVNMHGLTAMAFLGSVLAERETWLLHTLVAQNAHS
jgi:hypothetical protein